jgi:hypothetical protein
VICKVVHRKSGKKAGFEGLGRYILNAKENDTVLFKRTAEYVLDAKGVGEKVAWCRISNCHSEVPAAAIAEVLATQSANQRAKSDKTYHLVVSFPAGERVSKEQAEDIEDSLCAGLGFEGHQRISAAHQDTDNFHIHIAINKIHPKTFNSVEPYNAYWKLDGIAHELERKHGLHRDNGIGARKSNQKAHELEAHQNEQSFLSFMRENIGGQVSETLKKARGWEDLHSVFAKYGAEIKPRGAGLAIATLDGKVGIKASSLDRQLSFKSLTERFGEYEPPKSNNKQLPTVKTWVNRVAVDLLKRQKQKQTRQDNDPGVNKKYEVGARKLAGSQSLYAEYQATREGNYAARKRVLEESRKTHGEARSGIKERYQARRASVKANIELDRTTKRSAYQELSQEMKTDVAQLKMGEQKDRQMLLKHLPVGSWEEFLAKRAESGDGEALGILRRRNGYRREIREALLTVERFEEALDYVRPQYRPTVLKNGKVIYRARDGGVVLDEAQGISVREATEGATVMALSLAAERFGSRALMVEGSDEFKRQVAKLSALEGLSIRFADGALERERHYHVQARELREEEQRQAIEEREREEGRKQLEQERQRQKEWEQRRRFERLTPEERERERQQGEQEKGKERTQDGRLGP